MTKLLILFYTQKLKIYKINEKLICNAPNRSTGTQKENRRTTK